MMAVLLTKRGIGLTKKEGMLKDWSRRATMEIYLRIPKGWSKPVLNHSKETCDVDGARLWIGPGNQIYCDQEHDLETVAHVVIGNQNHSSLRELGYLAC